MKTLFKYLLMCMPLTASLLFITACSDDEPADPYDANYVYIYSPANTDNTLEYKGNGTFLVDIAPECVVNPVRCTKPAPEDLTVQLAIDPSLVESYNQANGTNYTLLKNARLENATLYIKQGEYESADSLKVRYTDMSEFQNGAENYILPIAITAINSSDVSLSESSKIYLTFSSHYRVNLVEVSVSQNSMELIHENGGFTNLAGQLELEDIIKSSWLADDDISVSLKIDQGMVDTYNALNSTNLKFMPNASLENATTVIRKGAKTIEDPIVITFPDNMASVELGQGYLLPVTIEKVDGIGAAIGETVTTYMVFKTIEKVTISVEDAPIGVAISDFTDWNLTVNGQTAVYGVPWMNLVTSPGGNRVSALYASSVMELDMGKQQKISSIHIEYYSRSLYSATEATFEFSMDGVNYKRGECKMDAAIVQNFILKYPFEVRYIRIKNVKSNRGAYPVGLILYTNE
ncbi:DUF1735 domain-containing protein [uncultured Bacteroides sp.]|uniref:BT_3987 domain-containing protein n=1 Tax=uncultured Bacteroides sp. TaxID=162156 RepID=UPI002600A041|nr:DUF1735 domain-containing protein [uncultured Bacteroides sp.]